jgi:hypothetical protein
MSDAPVAIAQQQTASSLTGQITDSSGAAVLCARIIRTPNLEKFVADPSEFRNVWNDPHYNDTQEMMLQNLVIEITDPLPERHAT